MKNPFFLLLIFGILILFPVLTQAGTEDNVSGWAWSENIGWVSFNCTNQDSCSVVDYGVNIDSTGLFSGFAWSEHIGWISFNTEDLVGCPVLPCEARVNLETGQVSGWAKALAGSNGWEGWIRLRNADYGVYIDLNSGEFQDWAWGETVIGWLSFNCQNQNVCQTSDYKVIVSVDIFNRPPSAVNLQVTEGDYCGAPYPPIFLSWQFLDPDPGDSQSAYQVQVDNNSDFSSPEVDSGKVLSNSTEYAPINLSYATTYYWRVKVWDQEDLSSDWSQGPSFTTAWHPYPDVDFSWSPPSPSVNEEIQFTDQTTFYDGKASWFWDFGDGESSGEQNPTHSYSDYGNYTVTLTATDSTGYSCPCSKSLTIGIPLPQYKEIPPIFWLKKILASLNGFWKYFLMLF